MERNLLIFVIVVCFLCLLFFFDLVSFVDLVEGELLRAISKFHGSENWTGCYTNNDKNLP